MRIAGLKPTILFARTRLFDFFPDARVFLAGDAGGHAEGRGRDICFGVAGKVGTSTRGYPAQRGPRRARLSKGIGRGVSGTSRFWIMQFGDGNNA